MKIMKVEQETIINFNAQEKMATVYTRDPAVMRQLDAIVIANSETYSCIAYTDIDRTCLIPKSSISYCKSRRVSEERRERMRKHIDAVNEKNRERNRKGGKKHAEE